MVHTAIHVTYHRSRKGQAVPQAKLTLFHGMLLLQSWLNFLHLLGEKVYLPLEEVLGILSCLQDRSSWGRVQTEDCAGAPGHPSVL